jgi:hypothetical protein
VRLVDVADTRQDDLMVMCFGELRWQVVPTDDQQLPVHVVNVKGQDFDRLQEWRGNAGKSRRLTWREGRSGPGPGPGRRTQE